MTPAATPCTILIDEVSVERNGVRVLESVAATIDAHRIAVIGANGSGKSTFARLLNGLIAPSSGSVRVAGLDPVRQARKVRELVAFLFTNPESQIIMPTVAEDVAFSLRGSGLPREEVARRVIGILSDYGLDGLADRSAHELSGGQKQLLALCSGLVRAPQILVADEPTTLLDAANTRRVSDALVALPQQLIVVTHDLSLAARCDTALLFDRGRLITQGDPTEVIARYEQEFC